jgi:hypothetical protein
MFVLLSTFSQGRVVRADQFGGGGGGRMGLSGDRGPELGSDVIILK